MAATKVHTPEELRAQLKGGSIAPVYLFAGPDTHRAERTARWLREHSLDDAMGDFNAETRYADESSPAQIAEAASAFPMFGGRRVVWVRHAEALPSGAAIEPLLKYLESPAEPTVLLFTSSKLDKRLKFTGACAKVGCVVDFGALTGAGLIQQVGRQAREHGLALDADAVETLVELVGEDLGELDTELAKLALQEGAAGREIGADEVRTLVARSRDVNAFALADQLDGRAPAGALAQWFALRQSGGDVMGCAAILAWRLRQLAQLRATLDAGVPAQAAAKECGLAPWQARRTLPLAQSNSTQQIEGTIEAWRTADRRAKSSSLGAPLAYDLAILRWASRT